MRAIEIDNRRKENRTERVYDHWVHPSQFSKYRNTGNLAELRNGLDTSEYDLIIASGGDGTLAYIFDSIRQSGKEPAVYYKGGGSASTLLRGIVDLPIVSVPDQLCDIFEPEAFETRNYHPLIRENEEGVKACGAYLGGFGHLTTKVTEIKEWLYNHKLIDAHVAYKIAGAASVLSLNNRVQPEVVRYKKNGKDEEIDTRYLAEAAVVTIPRLGTFSFRGEVSDDEVWLLTMAGESNWDLTSSYIKSLFVGGLLNKPDRVIEKGLVQVQNANEVQIYPGQPEDANRPNVCFDGELGRVEGGFKLYRDPQALTIITPKSLTNQAKRIRDKHLIHPLG